MIYRKKFDSAATSQKSKHSHIVSLFFAACLSVVFLLFTQLRIQSQPAIRERSGYWSRAKAAIAVANSETLENIFAQMSKQELEILFWKIAVGEVKASPQEETLVRELRHMVEDLGPDAFWNATRDRAAAISDAIAKYDRRVSDPDLATTVRLLDASIGKTDLEIVTRALAEHFKNANYRNSRWSDRATRFMSPYYDPVRTILHASKSIRRRLQLLAAIESPLSEAILNYRNSGKLTEADFELEQLRSLQRSTAEQIANVRRDMKLLYGRDVSATRSLMGEDIWIPELARRARMFRSTEGNENLQSLGEKNMRALERILKIPVVQKHDAHLQINNEQFRRETPLLVAEYLSVLRNRTPSNASYEVRTDWIVTVRHEQRRERKWTRDVPDGDGRISRTETYHDYSTDQSTSTYPMSRTDTMQMSYEELLQNRIVPGGNVDKLPALPLAEPRGKNAVAASNGKPFVDLSDLSRTDIILEQAATARRNENYFRSRIFATIELINKISNEVYKAGTKDGGPFPLLTKLELEERRLVSIRERLAQYQALDASSIKIQWPNDIETDFRDRNQALLKLYDHTITRLAHLNEQVRRVVPSLIVEVAIVDYQVELELLKSVRDRNKDLIRDSTIGAGLTGLALFGYQHQSDILDVIRALSGSVGP